MAPNLPGERGPMQLADVLDGVDALQRDRPWLDLLLEQERPVATVGHSYGALLLMDAARRGAPTGRLALLEPIAFGLGGPDARATQSELEREFMAALEEGRARDAMRWLVDYWNGPGAFDSLHGMVAARLVAGVAHTAAEVLAGRRDDTTDERVRALQGALVMAGTETTGESKAVCRALGEAVGTGVSWVSGAGHQFPRTHGAQVADALAAWLG